MNKQLNSKEITNYVSQYYPNLKFWDGITKWSILDNRTFKHRQGMPNEIRIEFDGDDRGKNFEATHLTCINLWSARYTFAVYYVEGGRSPHIHIYDIDEMDTLTEEQRKIYRKLFLDKFCPKGYKCDYELCDEKHMCALEFANHFKYNKPKLLLNYFWQGSNQGCDYDLKVKAMEYEEKKTKMEQTKIALFSAAFNPNEPFKKRVMEALTFEAVFNRYGVKYRGDMALCPFHSDKDMSLSFTNEKKLFHCFGCNAKGNIFTLIKMLEKFKT